MSEQIKDQISAFTDDELSDEECAFLVRRLARDPGTRDRVLRYSIIGDAMRGELPNPDPDVLRQRIREELDGVRSAESAPVMPDESPRLLRPAIGFGIAATVAVAALVTLNTVNTSLDTGGTSEMVAGTRTGAPVGDDSYIVPQEPAEILATDAPLAPPPIRLTNYLITHGEYARGIRRTSIHTDVISNEGTSLQFTTVPAEER